MSTPSPIPQTAAETPPPEKPDNFRGIVWILVSVVGASVMSIAVRELSGAIDSRMIVLLRSGLIALALIPGALVLPGLRKLRFSRPGLHLVRGTLIGLSTHLGFYTLANLPLATAAVLFFTAPIFATILAATFKGEQVGARRWAAVLAGFAGAIIILRPGAIPLEPAMLAAIASSAMFAVALTLSRDLAQADGAASAYVSSVVITLVVSVPLALPVWSLPEGSVAWMVMAVLVISGAMRGFADIEAYRHGEAAVLAPITYLRLVIIGLAAYWLYDEVPDTATLIGAAVIVLATLYIAHRAAVRARAAKSSAAATVAAATAAAAAAAAAASPAAR